MFVFCLPCLSSGHISRLFLLFWCRLCHCLAATLPVLPLVLGRPLFFLWNLQCLHSCSGPISSFNAMKCDVGYYGIGCWRKCSEKCKDEETCDSINGQCPNGCEEGFIGEKCDSREYRNFITFRSEK
ncbi:hypothetical protein B566_EDAN006333, partial [Ephemera danica]